MKHPNATDFETFVFVFFLDDLFLTEYLEPSGKAHSCGFSRFLCSLFI